MRDRRAIAILLLLILTFSLVSCKNEHKGHESSHNGQNNIEEPEDDTTEEEPELTYVYSVVTKVLHLPGCYHIGSIKEEYIKEHTGDISILLQNGYTICRDCMMPDESEEEPEEEEDTNKIAKEDATFVINKSSGVIHKLDCGSLKTMKESNIEYTDLTLEELISEEQRPCGSCMPDEAKEYEKMYPDEDKKK